MRTGDVIAACACYAVLPVVAWSIFFRTPWPAIALALGLFSLDWLLNRRKVTP